MTNTTTNLNFTDNLKLSGEGPPELELRYVKEIFRNWKSYIDKPDLSPELNETTEENITTDSNTTTNSTHDSSNNTTSNHTNPSEANSAVHNNSSSTENNTASDSEPIKEPDVFDKYVKIHIER